MGFILKQIKNLPVMEIGMREDPINSAADRAQLGHAALFDGHSAGEVFVAVEEAGGPVQGVAGVVDSRALLWCFMSCAEEDPLLRCGHLGAGLRLTLRL